MSLLQHAEKCLGNQAAHLGRNAYLAAPKELSSLRNAVREAELRAKNLAPKSTIDGRLIAIKDNICTKGYPTTCGSKLLERFTSPYNATVVEKLQAAGAIVCGKTNLDEFGMGSHSVNSAFGAVEGWKDGQGDALSPGGSSGGSAVAVATEQCWAALGTDTGGSSRLPAAFNGVVGFKPSYGRLSRHGVVAYANSLDTVGILAPNTQIAKQVYQAVEGPDPKDPTCLNEESRVRIAEHVYRSSAKSPLRIGIPMELNIEELDVEIRSAWLRTLEQLQDAGHELYSVSIPAIRSALSAYYVIAPAEASSNLAKYDGIRYGSASEVERHQENVLYSGTRGKGLGPEVQRRILLGAYSLSATAMDNYFLQAQRIRRLVCNGLNNVFALQNPLTDKPSKVNGDSPKVDILVSPTTPSLSPKIAKINSIPNIEAYRGDVMTVPANMAGLPAISVPMSTGKLSSETVGVHITGQYGDDEMVLYAASLLEKLKII